MHWLQISMLLNITLPMVVGGAEAPQATLKPPAPWYNAPLCLWQRLARQVVVQTVLLSGTGNTNAQWEKREVGRMRGRCTETDTSNKEEIGQLKKKKVWVMLMPVAMVIGVNDWLPWSLLLGILGRGYFDNCVCVCVCVYNAGSLITPTNLFKPILLSLKNF